MGPKLNILSEIGWFLSLENVGNKEKTAIFVNIWSVMWTRDQIEGKPGIGSPIDFWKFKVSHSLKCFEIVLFTYLEYFRALSSVDICIFCLRMGNFSKFSALSASKNRSLIDFSTSNYVGYPLSRLIPDVDLRLKIDRSTFLHFKSSELGSKGPIHTELIENRNRDLKWQYEWNTSERVKRGQNQSNRTYCIC